MGSFFQQSEVKQREGEQPGQRQEGGGGGFAEVVGIPRQVLDVVEQHGGGIVRPAAGHHRHVVNLGDGVDQRRGDDEAQGWAQQRQGDLKEHLAAGGTFHNRRFAGRGRDALQAGEKKQHVVAGKLPHPDQRQRQQGGVAAPQPVVVHRADDLRQVVVEQAEAGHKDKQPQRGGADHRDNHREEEGGAQPAVDAVVFAQRHRQQQGEGHARHHRQQDIEQVVDQRLPEDAIGEQAGEVIEADELRAVAHHPGIEQAVVDRSPQREPGKEQ